jgi:hypothetical protein
MCDIYQAKYPCVMYKYQEEVLWQFLVKKGICDTFIMAIFGKKREDGIH